MFSTSQFSKPNQTGQSVFGPSGQIVGTTIGGSSSFVMNDGRLNSLK